jgi:hypothetical protein
MKLTVRLPVANFQKREMVMTVILVSAFHIHSSILEFRSVVHLLCLTT